VLDPLDPQSALLDVLEVLDPIESRELGASTSASFRGGIFWTVMDDRARWWPAGFDPEGRSSAELDISDIFIGPRKETSASL
jgi:hypothetical protein